MDFLNVATFATSSSSTKVLVLDGNTVKSRTASQVVTDGGGGSGSSGKSFQITLYEGLFLAAYPAIYLDSAADGWGWPQVGAVDQPDSILKCVKFLVPFKPTNYRFSARCISAPSYWAGSTPSSGQFGVKIQYSDNDSTWTTIDTVDFKGKTTGNLAGANGTLSISSSASLFYMRVLCVNTLASPASGAEIEIRSFVADFWN
jgi:hypothetical protein